MSRDKEPREPIAPLALPVLDKSKCKPAIVYMHLEQNDKDLLVNAGYTPIALMELDKNTPEDRVKYIQYMLQGIQDGTVCPSDEQLKALELEMKHRGMLDRHSYNMTMSLNADSTIKELWDWKDSRHTLNQNATFNYNSDDKPKLKGKSNGNTRS